MTSGWTGGQYSIYRALLAIAVAYVLGASWIGPAASHLDRIVAIAILCGCVALAIGWRDRIAAGVLTLIGLAKVAFIEGAPFAAPGPAVSIACALLVLHCAAPPDPYGAWTARARPDPRGNWRMPSALGHVSWSLLAVVYLVGDLESLAGAAFRSGALEIKAQVGVGLLFDIVLSIAVFRVRWRPGAWFAMSVWKLACFFAFGPPSNESILWILHLSAVDPGWLPGRPIAGTSAVDETKPPRPARLFYDGDCGLCHRSVRFILAEEAGMPQALRLRFAPLGSASFDNLLAEHPELDRADLPDSIVLETEDGRILTRSRAALEIASRLGGAWRVIAYVVRAGGLVPHSALDVAYDGIARVRKKIFARPKASCPILPPELRARFDL